MDEVEISQLQAHLRAEIDRIILQLGNMLAGNYGALNGLADDVASLYTAARLFKTMIPEVVIEDLFAFPSPSILHQADKFLSYLYQIEDCCTHYLKNSSLLNPRQHEVFSEISQTVRGMMQQFNQPAPPKVNKGAQREIIPPALPANNIHITCDHFPMTMELQVQEYHISISVSTIQKPAPNSALHIDIHPDKK